MGFWVNYSSVSWLCYPVAIWSVQGFRSLTCKNQLIYFASIVLSIKWDNASGKHVVFSFPSLMRREILCCHFTGTTNIYSPGIERPVESRITACWWARRFHSNAFLSARKPTTMASTHQTLWQPFKYVNLYNPHNHTMQKVLLLSLFNRWGNWDRELCKELTHQ